jgi:hypothetical protein
VGDRVGDAIELELGRAEVPGSVRPPSELVVRHPVHQRDDLGKQALGVGDLAAARSAQNDNGARSGDQRPVAERPRRVHGAHAPPAG